MRCERCAAWYPGMTPCKAVWGNVEEQTDFYIALCQNCAECLIQHGAVASEQFKEKYKPIKTEREGMKNKEIEKLELRVAELIKERDQYHKQLQEAHGKTEEWRVKYQQLKGEIQ
jgi:hypothetical protein